MVIIVWCLVRSSKGCLFGLFAASVRVLPGGRQCKVGHLFQEYENLSICLALELSVCAERYLGSGYSFSIARDTMPNCCNRIVTTANANSEGTLQNQSIELTGSNWMSCIANAMSIRSRALLVLPEFQPR